MVRAYVGLGSNVGDRLAHLRSAAQALCATEGVEVVASSSVYETVAVGPPQPDFLNAVVAIDTTVAPRELVAELKRIEREVGRTPGERWGPREVDLDLLLHGSSVTDEPDLRVPHAELVRRAFVLVPLAEIAPDVDVPGAGQVRSLLDAVGTAGVRPHAGPLL